MSETIYAKVTSVILPRVVGNYEIPSDFGSGTSKDYWINVPPETVLTGDTLAITTSYVYNKVYERDVFHVQNLRTGVVFRVLDRIFEDVVVK